MKKNNLALMVLLLTTMSITFTSCEAIMDIFAAGMWFGVIGVVVVVIIVIWLIRRMTK